MASKTSLKLTERQAQAVETYYRIAKENGALVTLRELSALASIEANEEEFEEALAEDPELRSRFIVESGYVLEKSEAGKDDALGVLVEEERSKQRARANLDMARDFGRFLAGGTLLVSVGGANSYLSARQNEDIDFFCVTRTGGLWPFMVKGLLLARIYRLTHQDVPDLCFSFEMDMAWAARAFSTVQEPIFARDALTAKVMSGWPAYHRLLEDARWMGHYFPTFYNMRMRETDLGDGLSDEETRGSAGLQVLNSFLYYTVGTFLRMKSWALNRRFTKLRRQSSVFAARIGRDCCIYESNRYVRLGRMYRALDDAER